MPVQEVIPDQEPVVAQAPTNRVSHFEYARSGSYLAAGMEKLAEGLDAVATPFAEQQASADAAQVKVTRDANGTPIVQKPATMPIFGPAGAHYDATIAAGALAQGNVSVSDDIANLRAQHEGDPDAFKGAVTAYTQRMQASNPGVLGASMAQHAGQLGNQYYLGMVNEKARVDTENAKGAINDAMTAKFNELAALAQQGGTATPEYQKARADYGAMSRQLVANPAFGVSQAIQDSNDRQTDNLLAGYATVGRVDQAYKSSGIVAARKELYDSVNDPSLNLSPKERNQLIEQGDARLRFLTGQNAADIAANGENIRALDEAAKNPKTMAGLSEPIWQAAIAKATSLGDHDGVARLAAMHEVWQHDLATRGMSPNQQAATHAAGQATPSYDPTTGKMVTPADITSGPAANIDKSIPPEGRALLATIAGPESAGAYNVRYGGATFNNGFADHPRIKQVIASGPNAGQTSDAAGRYQFLSSTWDQEAAKLGLKDFSPASQDKAAWDLAQTTYKSATGGDLLTALKSKDPATLAGVASALRGQWTSLPGGVEQGTTADKFQTAYNGALAGQGQTAHAPSVNGGTYSAADYAANPFLLSAQVRAIAGDSATRNAYAHNLLDATEQSIRNGFAPQPNIGAQVIQLATDPNASPEVQQKAQRVAGLAAGMALAGQAINVPPGQGQALLDHYRTLAQSSGDLFQQSIAEEFKASLAARQEQLKKDPWGFAAANSWIKSPPNPLTFDDPTALGVALHQRDYAASAIAARTGDNTVSAIAPDELPQVRSVLENGTPQQQATFWQAMGTLSPDRRAATLRELGGNDPATMAKVAAGSLMTTAPDIAQSIMRGQNAIKADKQWAPDEQATASVGKSGYGADLDKALPSTIFNVNDRTNPAGAYATTVAMVRARYADLAAQAGDKSYSADRVTQAVNDVTGGVLNMNGGSFIAPVRGMDQAHFDGMMQGVGDSNLAGVTTLSGRPITADYLRSNGQLENAGDGKYFVRLGSDPSRPVYAYSGANGEMPTRFVLDLSNRPAAPIATPPVSAYSAATGMM